MFPFCSQINYDPLRHGGVLWVSYCCFSITSANLALPGLILHFHHSLATCIKVLNQWIACLLELFVTSLEAFVKQFLCCGRVHCPAGRPLPLRSAVVMKGWTQSTIAFGWVVHVKSGVYMNARTQGFPTDHLSVTRRWIHSTWQRFKCCGWSVCYSVHMQ